MSTKAKPLSPPFTTEHIVGSTWNFASWGWVIPLLLILTALAVPRLGESLWTDEQRTLWYTGAPPQYGPVPITESIARIADNVWQAPFYFTVLRVWGMFVGWSELTLRSLSLFLGLLTVSGLYRLTTRHFTREIAFYATFTFSAGAFWVNYLHEMRAYTLMVLLVVIMVSAYDRITLQPAPVTRFPLWSAYLLLTLSVTAQMYTHYFNLFPIAALGLFHLIFRWGKPRYWQTLTCFIVGGLLFFPWLQVFIAGALRSTEDDRRVRNMSLLTMSGNLLYMFANGGIALMIILLGVALREWRRAQFVWFILLASIGLVILTTRFFPALFEIRYLLFMWLPLSVLSGVALARLRRDGLPAALLLAIWLGAGLWHISDPAEQARIHRWPPPPLKELHAALVGRTLPDDVVMFHLPPLTPHGDDPGLIAHYTHGLDIVRGRTIPDNYATTDDHYRTLVLEAIEDADRVWVSFETDSRNWRIGGVESDILPPLGFTFCGEVERSEAVTLRLFAKQPDGEPLIFTEPESTIPVYLHGTPRVHNGTAEVGIVWQLPDDIVPNQHSIAVQIEDAADRVIAQADYGITANGWGCGYAQFDDLPTGDYQARLTVYRWQTGAALSAGSQPRPLIGTLRLH